MRKTRLGIGDDALTTFTFGEVHYSSSAFTGRFRLVGLGSAYFLARCCTPCSLLPKIYVFVVQQNPIEAPTRRLDVQVLGSAYARNDVDRTTKTDMGFGVFAAQQPWVGSAPARRTHLAAFNYSYTSTNSASTIELLLS